MWQKIKDWIEIRIGLDELIKSQLTEYRVPGTANLLYTLGIVSLVAYMVQAVTGFFLLFYYIPHTDHAFRSVQEIMMVVPYGWLFRLVHVVGSNLMVAVVLLHLLSVFVMGSYKKPREMTWVAGGILLLVTLAFCLSGYLLPWSQLSYWATTIVTTIPTAFPYVGDYFAKILRGSDSVTGITLNRFFALHVALLPPILVSTMAFHFFLVRRIGVSAPPFGLSGKTSKPWTGYRHEGHREGMPFYPDFVTKEALMVTVYFAVMFLIITLSPTLFLPEDANTPANPLKTPTHIKPEWYFLAPYQMLKIVPNRFLGISLQAVLIVLFLLWPFFDRKEEDNLLKRPVLRSVFIAAVTVWAVLTVWGKYS